MSEQNRLLSLLEADRLTSIFKVFAATHVHWTTWIASNATDAQSLVRAEADLRRQGAIVKRVGKEIWYFCLSEKDKSARQALLATQPLTEIGQEQDLDLSGVAFSTADTSNATDLFIALRILKEALVLQMTFRCAEVGFVPLGPCLLSPLPELDEHSFDNDLRLKPLPNGKYPGPQRQWALSLNLAVTGDLTLAFAKTDVELIALDMHSSKLACDTPVFLAPSGLKATLIDYSAELADDTYRLRLSQLIGYNLVDTSRWVRIRIDNEDHLWPSSLTFILYNTPQVKPNSESWFELHDTWLARCKADMERKKQDEHDAETEANDSPIVQLPQESSMPLAPVAQSAVHDKDLRKDESTHVYPTPPDATPGPLTKKLRHDSDDEDIHVTDADFSFFDQNSPDTIMQEIEEINHLPTPGETDNTLESRAIAQPADPSTAILEMITPASQFAATPHDVPDEVHKAAASLREEHRRHRQPIPSRFTAVPIAKGQDQYGPGGKYYATSSASSAAEDDLTSDEEMADVNYDQERAALRGVAGTLLGDIMSEEDEPPPPDIPWHLLLPRAALNPIKAAHLDFRTRLEKLALPANVESDLIDSVGALLCGPSIAGFRDTSILPANSFNADIFETDWFNDDELKHLVSCCKETFGQAPLQLKLEDVAAVYEDPLSSKTFKPKVPQRRQRSETPSHVTLLSEPKMLLSRAHIDDKTHKQIVQDYEMSTAAIRYWYTAQLSPLDGPKDAVHYVFFPEGELVQHAAFRYLDDLRALYYGCNLGAFHYEDKIEDSYLPFGHNDNSKSFSQCFNKIQYHWLADKQQGLSKQLNIVLHFLNPYQLHDAQFLSFLDMVNKFKKSSAFVQVVLQIVDLEQVCQVDGFKALDLEDGIALCLQIYNRCQLTSVGSDPKLYAPAYQLAQPGIESFKGFHISVEDFPSILDDGSSFHIAYSCTPGHPWVTVAWSDALGQAFRARQFRLRSDGTKGPASSDGYASIAAVFVEIWRYTMELISVFPINWHLVVTKVGKRISADEINAWLRMGALEKGRNKFRISVMSVDTEPLLLVQPPLLAHLQTKLSEEQEALQGMTREEQQAYMLKKMTPKTPPDVPLAAALEKPIGNLDDPSEKVFAIKLSKFQVGPSKLGEPQPLASAYLVKPQGLNVTQSAATLYLSIFHLDERSAIDDLLQETRNLASLAHVGGFTYRGGIIPRHIMHVAVMHTALNGYKP